MPVQGFTRALLVVLVTTGCGTASTPHRDDPQVVAEVQAVLSSDASVRAYMAQFEWFDVEPFERMLRGAPAESATLTLRAVALLAADAGAAAARGEPMPVHTRKVGSLIGTLNKSVGRLGRGAVATALAKGYGLSAGDELAGAIADKHFVAMRDAYLAARDPSGLRERVKASPELDRIDADYRAFVREVDAAYAAAR